MRYAKLVKIGQQFVRKRSYKNFSATKFLEEIQKVRWWQVYRCENVDEAVEVFRRCLTSILDRQDMAPVKTFQARRNFASWLSEETKEQMSARDQAMEKFNKTGLTEDWDTARTLRNHVTRLLKSEKCNDARWKVRSCEEERDTGRVWKNIRGYLGWGATGGAPTCLTDNAGRLITSPAAMAELQNQFYIEKVKNIRAKLPQQGAPTAVLQQHMLNRPRPRPKGLTLACASPEAVDKMITNLKNSKSCGLDNIDTHILKLARHFIVPSITHIVNLSITSLVFPKSFKTAKVVPLYKGKESSTTAPKSYRPVALLPVVSKILERVVQNQLVAYMDRNQLWHPQHHAYRSHHSTTTAMLGMHDSWVEAAEHGKLTGVSLIDMSAAFDVVDTEILLEKCRLFNFTPETEQWLWSYLTSRSQCTYISGSTSSSLPLVAGVPQGSILGPALYTLYTCDFPEVVHEADCPHSPLNRPLGELAMYRTICTECGGVVCFADDSTYTVTADTEEELSQKLTSKFELMSEYLTQNRLCINTDKTHMMVICTDQKRRHINTQQVILNTGSELIYPTPLETLLGVTVYQGLGFGPYILTGKNSIISSLGTRIGL